MSIQAISTFENISWAQSVYDEPAESPSIHRATVARRFQGALTGESIAELFMCQSADDQAGYVATDRFMGRLDSRAGSFVFQHGGALEHGVPRPFGYIVPGSGTDDVRGLRGEVRIAVTAEGEHTLTLDYDFE